MKHKYQLIGAAGFFFLLSTPGWCQLAGVSAGVTYPTALGSTYQTIDTIFGGTATLMLKAPWIGPGFGVHSTVYYEPYNIRTQPTMKINSIGVLAGVDFWAGQMGKSVTPFAQADVGVAINMFSFSSVAAPVTNSSMNLAAQLNPGVDIPVSDAFGVIVQLPVRMVFAPAYPIVFFNPGLSVRMKL